MTPALAEAHKEMKAPASAPPELGQSADSAGTTESAELTESNQPDEPCVPPEVQAMSRVKVGLGFGLALGVAAVSSFVLFRMLNRTRVEGLENIPESSENVLYCLNHNSILDNFAFESAVFLPRMLLRPQYLPIQLADRKNFFGDPRSKKLRDKVMGLIGRHFLRHLRAFPVDRKAGDMAQVDHWIELLKQNIVVVFPEGTRSRSGEIGNGKAGVGKLIYKSRPTVIPVRMIGMSRVLGVGKVVPNTFETIQVFIDKPLDMSEFLDRPLPEDNDSEMAFYKDIANHVVAAIRRIAPDIPEPVG